MYIYSTLKQAMCLMRYIVFIVFLGGIRKIFFIRSLITYELGLSVCCVKICFTFFL